MFSNDLVCDILIYIENNINLQITIDELSKTFNFDRTYIMKKFKKELSVSIIDYINKVRIYNSLKDYKSNDYILRIALKNGFQSLEYYSEMFKRIMNVNPRTYKKSISSINSVKEVELRNIIRTMIELQELKERCENYKTSRKLKELPVKKLSIFK